MEPRRFVRLIEPHLDVLHRLARRLAGSAADAEDLAQEALLRAFLRRGDLREEARLRPWLLATLRNLHLNHRRDSRADRLVLDGDRPIVGSPAEPRGDLADELHRRSLSDETARALAVLPEEGATALWLREVEGLSYEELAVVLEVPVGTVRSRLSRARAAFARALEGAGPVTRAEGGRS